MIHSSSTQPGQARLAHFVLRMYCENTILIVNPREEGWLTAFPSLLRCVTGSNQIRNSWKLRQEAFESWVGGRGDCGGRDACARTDWRGCVHWVA